MDAQNNQDQGDLEREYLDFLDDEVSSFLFLLPHKRLLYFCVGRR